MTPFEGQDTCHCAPFHDGDEVRVVGLLTRNALPRHYELIEGWDGAVGKSPKIT
jgi:hypothetical protein